MPRLASVNAHQRYNDLKGRQIRSKKGFETPPSCLVVKGKQKDKGASKQPTGFNKVAQGADCVYGKLAITDAPTVGKGLVFGCVVAL